MGPYQPNHTMSTLTASPDHPRARLVVSRSESRLSDLSTSRTSLGTFNTTYTRPAVDFRAPRRSSTLSNLSEYTIELASSNGTGHTSTTSLTSSSGQSNGFSTSNGTSTLAGLHRPVQVSPRSSFTGQQRHSRPPAGGKAIDRLPSEVMDKVVAHLRKLHQEPLQASCTTCFLRDLHSICMASKTWRRAARQNMYKVIWLIGHDSVVHVKKKFRISHGARLILLRRTLRGNPVLAQLVRELKVPDILDPCETTAAETEKYTDLVASVVMACPNLESLTGIYPEYDHRFDRLSHALSTRPKLKEHVWVMTGPEWQGNRLQPGNDQQPLVRPAQMDTFIYLHVLWNRLETLFLHSQMSGTIDHYTLIAVLARLPSLQHLYISNFSRFDFGDATLLSLPPLQSLRLEKLQGVSDRGIRHFSSSVSAQALRTLSLIDLEVSGLSTFSKLFASLRNLRSFTLQQEKGLQASDEVLIFQPLIASATVESLHWDVLDSLVANEQLAASVLAGGFPNLRTLRAPSDHSGVLQGVCRPMEQAAISSDKYSFLHRRNPSSGPRGQTPPGNPSSPTMANTGWSKSIPIGHHPASPTKATWGGPKAPRPSELTAYHPLTPPHSTSLSAQPDRRRSLFTARQAAQSRIEDARNSISFRFVIEDEARAVKQILLIPGFAGSSRSPIGFSLQPDVHGSDQALLELADLIDEGRGREKEREARDGCTGAWNSTCAGGKKWWSHTSRGRWKPTELNKFF